jgi:hypothetical protein
MVRIDIQTEAFASQHGLHSFDVLNPSWDDILWAAITIGRPNVHYVFQYGKSSLYEALFRISMVRMALEQARPWSRHTLRRTELFKQMDPTEKGAINYFLGMVFCKVFSAERLSIPWLLHVDVFKAQLSPSFLSGRSRPDLVGLSTATGDWAAFECKGRASPPTAADKSKAKAQAQRLRSVNGSACTLHVAAFTYYGGDTLRMYCEDPDGDERGEDFRTSDQSWRHYYKPAYDLFERLNGEREATELIAGDGRDIDLEIKIHPEIFRLLQNGEWEAAHRACLDLGPLLLADGFKPDGIRILAGKSWRERFVTAPAGK